jgi:hypothetical protein
MKVNIRKSLFAVFVFLFLVFLSLIRPLNPDEPYYNVCSALVLSCKLPYSDFFFHHMPLMLFVYAPFSFGGFWSLILGRFLSALFLFATGLIIYRYLFSKGINKKYLRLFLLLFFFNSYLLDWLLIIRVYAITTFLFVTAVLSFDKIMSFRNKYFGVFICGLFFSLLSLSKIVFISQLFIFIFFLYFFYRNQINFKDKKVWLSLIIGILIPFALFFLLFLGHLRFFFDDVYTANMLIKNNLQSSILPHLYKPFLFLIFPQSIILLAIIFFSGFKYSAFEKFILLNISVYFILHLFTLMLLEYTVSIIPFLILLAVLRYEQFSANVKIYFKKIGNSPAIFARIVIVLYLLSFPFSLPHIRYLLEGKFIMPNVIELNNMIKIINSVPGKTTITSWEGYTVYSDKKTIFEDNYISNFFDYNLDEKKKLSYRLNFPVDYRKLIENKIPDVIIYDEHDPAHLLGLHENIVMNYTFYASYGNVLIYTKSN